MLFVINQSLCTLEVIKTLGGAPLHVWCGVHKPETEADINFGCDNKYHQTATFVLLSDI